MTEALHQAALVPLVVALLVKAERPWLLVAVAFAVSWAGDSVAHYAGGSFVASYFWLPVQFALAGTAFAPKDFCLTWASALLGAFTVLAVVSYANSGPGPDFMLTAAGSIGLMVACRGRLLVPVMLYFGLGSVCYLLMIQRIDAVFMPAWSLYQGARLAAFTAFCLLVVTNRGKVWANG